MIKEKFVSLASRRCVHTTKSEGDCKRHGVCKRSKRFLAFLCIPQTLSIMHFPSLPTEHRGQSACAPTCTHTRAYSSAWHLNKLSGEQFRDEDAYKLTATSGLVKVAYGSWKLTNRWNILTKHSTINSAKCIASDNLQTEMSAHRHRHMYL